MINKITKFIVDKWKRLCRLEKACRTNKTRVVREVDVQAIDREIEKINKSLKKINEHMKNINY